MGKTASQEQLIKYLEDVHSLEQNAIQTLKTGADQADNAALAQAFREHLTETEGHERLIRNRLEALGESTSSIKDIAQTGSAMLAGALAKVAPDTTGKFAIQAYAFEHLEIASYRMLRIAAERAGDAETEEIAKGILKQEEEAASRLDGLIEQVAEDDLRRVLASA